MPVYGAVLRSPSKPPALVLRLLSSTNLSLAESGTTTIDIYYPLSLRDFEVLSPTILISAIVPPWRRSARGPADTRERNCARVGRIYHAIALDKTRDRVTFIQRQWDKREATAGSNCMNEIRNWC